MAIDTNEKIAFLKKGKEIEEKFSKMFNDANPTTEEEDIKKHVDLKFTVGVDVKGMKKVSRSDQETNENIHWIEIKGVRDAGWLYGGHADFFAFETIDYWIIVEKQDLKDLIKKKIKKEYVLRPEDALYKLYRRKGRKDLITRVKSLDLMRISTRVFDKI